VNLAVNRVAGLVARFAKTAASIGIAVVRRVTGARIPNGARVGSA